MMLGGSRGWRLIVLGWVKWDVFGCFFGFEAGTLGLGIGDI